MPWRLGLHNIEMIAKLRGKYIFFYSFANGKLRHEGGNQALTTLQGRNTLSWRQATGSCSMAKLLVQKLQSEASAVHEHFSRSTGRVPQGCGTQAGSLATIPAKPAGATGVLRANTPSLPFLSANRENSHITQGRRESLVS